MPLNQHSIVLITLIQEYKIIRNQEMIDIENVKKLLTITNNKDLRGKGIVKLIIINRDDDR